jgi:hypothetical protein
MTQTKKGAIRKVMGVEMRIWIVDALAESGFKPDTANAILFPYTQTVSIETQITEGANNQLKGSSKIILSDQDDDILDFVKFSMKNALLELDKLAKVTGGTTRMDGTGKVKSWNPATNPNTVPKVYIRIFARNLEGDNNANGYIVAHVPYARLSIPTTPELNETDFWSIDITGKGYINPNYTDEVGTPDEFKGPMVYEFIEEADLPVGLK